MIGVVSMVSCNSMHHHLNSRDLHGTEVQCVAAHTIELYAPDAHLIAIRLNEREAAVHDRSASVASNQVDQQALKIATV
jgi:hypothetical protein